MVKPSAAAWLGGAIGTDLADITSDISALDSSGRWAVVIDFEGEPTCARFTHWRPGSPAHVATAWKGPTETDYRSSMTRSEYVAAVEKVRAMIAAGDVYQVNVCRTMTAELPDPASADVMALAALLVRGNPAPYAGCVRLPTQDIAVASASPELFLRRRDLTLDSGPIKGTGVTPADLSPKDEAENVMIVDLVRNDLSRVSRVGSVEVPSLLRIEEHPALTHLVSTVTAEIEPDVGWVDILAATFPPGSVSGAPKSSALTAISAVEPIVRGPYCGAIGWVDADSATAELAVGIRTFWVNWANERPRLHFGTGAGITWGSDPASEWRETELKASNLIAVASEQWKSRGKR
ncbi:MAG: chorismate-binding protein [Candidatus Nanopelagicales bacterium]